MVRDTLLGTGTFNTSDVATIALSTTVSVTPVRMLLVYDLAPLATGGRRDRRQLTGVTYGADDNLTTNLASPLIESGTSRGSSRRAGRPEHLPTPFRQASGKHTVHLASDLYVPGASDCDNCHGANAVSAPTPATRTQRDRREQGLRLHGRERDLHEHLPRGRRRARLAGGTLACADCQQAAPTSAATPMRPARSTTCRGRGCTRRAG